MFGSNFVGSWTCPVAWQNVWPSCMWDNVITCSWPAMKATTKHFSRYYRKTKRQAKMKGRDRKLRLFWMAPLKQWWYILSSYSCSERCREWWYHFTICTAPHHPSSQSSCTSFSYLFTWPSCSNPDSPCPDIYLPVSPTLSSSPHHHCLNFHRTNPSKPSIIPIQCQEVKVGNNYTRHCT